MGNMGMADNEWHEKSARTALERDHAREQTGVERLTPDEEEERQQLLRARERNESDHRTIVLRLAHLEKKRLGQAYRFQDDGWPR